MKYKKHLPIAIYGGRIIDPAQGIDQVGDLFVKNGKIVELTNGTNSIDKFESETAIELDATGLIITPGFIDIHCHLREPGYENKESIITGTKAAAAGGYTTICCMPNTSPPLDNLSIIKWLIDKINKEAIVNVLPVACITKGREGQELTEMAELAKAGVIAFSDDGDGLSNSRLMRSALEYCSKLGLPIMEHCEDKALSAGGVINEGWVSEKLGVIGIPAAAEEVMVARDLILAQLTKSKIHISHVSTEGSVLMIRIAKEKGIRVTAEVTPHNLTLTQNEVFKYKPGTREINTERCLSNSRQGLLTKFDSPIYNTNAKMYPPLRTEADIACLVEALKDGTIDAIATDHAPHTAMDKEGDLSSAAFGVSGFETAFGCLMGLVHTGKINLIKLISKLTYEPAMIIGKVNELGILKTGRSADITIFDPKREWIVDSNQFISKGKNTPFDKFQFKGKIMATIVNGDIAYIDNTLIHPSD
jgi:dihydroorotase